MSLVSIILPCKTQPNTQLLQDLEDQMPQPYDLHIQREEGITNAVWHGVHDARGMIIAIMDSDGTHQAKDLVRMLKLLHFYKADLAIGVRVCYTYPVMRRIISYASNILARAILNLDSKDPMSAIYVGHKRVMRFKNVQSCKFGLELQLRVKKLIEVEITPTPQPEHKSHLKPLEGVYLLLQLVRLRIAKN